MYRLFSQGWLASSSMLTSIRKVHRELILHSAREASYLPWKGSVAGHLHRDRIAGSLFEYTQGNLFHHARGIEHKRGEPSFQYLRVVSDAAWKKLPVYLPMRGPDMGEDKLIRLDWDHIKAFRQSQPWQVMVEQGLPLAVEEALRAEIYILPTNDNDISVALRC